MNKHVTLLYTATALAVILTAAIFVAPLNDIVVRAAEASDDSGSKVRFLVNDDPGSWFENKAGDITGTGTKSLGIINPGGTVEFHWGNSKSVHTYTSLLYPTGARAMPFDQSQAHDKSMQLTLQDPGLYVFVCKVHPYMLAAVIVDDANTQGLDLGEEVTLVNGIAVPTSSDLATRLLRTFFIITAPNNWQDYTSSTGKWHISYPDVDVRITGGTVVNLKQVLESRYGNDKPLPALNNPSTAGIGEVWVDTQYELTANKNKPGTATVVDVQTWQVERKVALPSINMNNPHNMWTDKDQKLIYQTQWFDEYLTVIDRETGKLVRNVKVGDAPAHVMTRTDTDQVHVTLNGEGSVVELSSGAKSIQRKISMQPSGAAATHPHAHWMSHDGKQMVTPNAFTADSTMYDFASNEIAAKVPVGNIPIATGMMPDASKYYVANFLDSTISVIDMNTKKEVKRINLLKNYDPITGDVTGPVGGLPIQTPVSPNGKYMVTANTLTATIVIIDTKTDEVVKMLGCDAGCHGVQFGAKQGGGYYAYVANKFSNAMLVVDADPNNDGNASDAEIVGRILLAASSTTAKDDTIVGNKGMGGQGVLAIPVPYNGWVQNLPDSWKNQLTAEQKNPIG